jgi:Carboxypeptidase regulatory-like domain
MRFRSGGTCVCAGVVFLLLVCTSPLQAQFDNGQISGFVRDASGSIVPGVVVTATNEATRLQREAVSNADGYYVFPSLIVGTYTVSAELQGFSRSTTTGVRLNSASRISVNISLEVGALTEGVEVSAAADAMVENAMLGRTVTALQVEQMPLSGRNPVFLARLQAGVVGGRLSGFGGTSIGTGIDSISGGRANDVLVTVDGAIANRTRSTENTMLGAQHADTVEEIQVLTSNYSAEYGRASSGIVRMVTRSGTSQFHGTLNYLLQNDALNSNTWSRNASGDPRLAKAAPWKLNQYGGTLGGPITIPGRFNSDRTKLFFFWGEEQLRRREETTQTLTVPSMAMRRGDFSELLNPANPYFNRARVVTDPRTGQPFPGNIIPADRISVQGRALLGVYPEPTPGFLQGTLNHIATYPTWQNQRKDTGRIDYRISDQHSLAFRVTHIPYTFNGIGGSTRFDELNSRPNRTAVGTLTTTLSSTFINELTISGSSDGYGVITNDPDCGARCKRSTYGVSYPFLFPLEGKLDPEKLPSLTVTGLSGLDMGPYPGYWSGYTYVINNNMTKVIGTHTVKWGGTLERSGQDDQIQGTTASAPATNNQNGAFRFLDAGHPQATGLSIANVLLGNFNDYSEFGAKPNTPFVATMFDAFVQDSWKASPRLTLEVGVRYSRWPAWRSKLNTLSMFHPDFYDPARAAIVDRAGGFIVSGDRYNGIVMPGDAPLDDALTEFPFLRNFTGMYHGLPDGLAPTQQGIGVVQPRFGMAYSINEKTSVRAGVGKFVNRTGINRDLAQGGQPPFMEQFTVINGSADAPGGAQRRDFPFTVSAQDPVLKHPMAFVGNITLQRQLPASMSLEVSYVGRRGYNNQRKRNINELPPGTVQANPGINPNALRPYRGLGIIGLAENSGRTRYDAMQISANRRMSAGLQVGVGYTWSKNMDNGSSETELLPYANDSSSYWGISDLDRTHVLMISYMYEPSVNSGSRLTRAILGGWSFSGINQIQSGSPFSVRQNVDYAGIGPGSGNQFWNQIGDPMDVTRTSFSGTSAVWFNPAAFAAPAAGTFGVQARNALRNPGFWEWNLSVRRRIPVVKDHTFDFRWDAFNVMNATTLGGANSNPTSGSFGLVTSKTGNRTMQLVLQYRW